MKPKRSRKILIAVSIVIIAVLLVPFRFLRYKDGGTAEYGALAYKIVVWNRFTDEGDIYRGTSVYLFPDSLKSIDELWETEKQKA